MSTGTFDVLCEILARDYQVEPESLTPQTRLQDINVDSLALIELIFALEERFGVKATDLPETLETLGQVAGYIDGLVVTGRAAADGAAPLASK